MGLRLMKLRQVDRLHPCIRQARIHSLTENYSTYLPFVKLIIRLCRHMALFGVICRYMTPFGNNCRHMTPFDAIWRYMTPFVAI